MTKPTVNICFDHFMVNKAKKWRKYGGYNN